jgi:hypothetical protein
MRILVILFMALNFIDIAHADDCETAFPGNNPLVPNQPASPGDHNGSNQGRGYQAQWERDAAKAATSATHAAMAKCRADKAKQELSQDPNNPDALRRLNLNNGWLEDDKRRAEEASLRAIENGFPGN